MRGGLVRDDVHGELAGVVAAQDLREDLGGVADVAHGPAAALFLGLQDLGDRGVEIGFDLVEVALAGPAAQAGLVDVDDQAGAVVQGDGERLGAAHAAAAAGEGQGAGEGAVLVPGELAGDRGEGLEGALQDALGADVDPGPGGHLAVHHQALGLEPAELGPGRPVAHEVGVGQQHPRRPFVGAEHADRLAGLDQQGLVLLHGFQGAGDGVERGPGPDGAAGAAVDHQVIGALGDLGVQVVHEHAQRGFGLPALGGELGAAGCFDRAGTGGEIGGCHEGLLRCGCDCSVVRCIRRNEVLYQLKPLRGRGNRAFRGVLSGIPDPSPPPLRYHFRLLKGDGALVTAQPS